MARIESWSFKLTNHTGRGLQLQSYPKLHVLTWSILKIHKLNMAARAVQSSIGHYELYSFFQILKSDYYFDTIQQNKYKKNEIFSLSL